ncbi:MAG: helix-turn-helix transcriptional regulator, partial [Deltaproteobacteria bacterium]|nr:helix-turn-helix transcriptional regulator [Deltaproteobacteria bacterium]
NARRMSQQQLAIESEVSTRHISYVENGKSSPSREMVLIFASALDLPLRERNSLLSTAGFDHPRTPRAVSRDRTHARLGCREHEPGLHAPLRLPPRAARRSHRRAKHHACAVPSARRPPVRRQLGGGCGLSDRSALPRSDHRARDQREPKAPRRTAPVSRRARAHARSRLGGGAQGVHHRESRKGWDEARSVLDAHHARHATRCHGARVAHRIVLSSE